MKRYSILILTMLVAVTSLTGCESDSSSGNSISGGNNGSTDGGDNGSGGDLGGGDNTIIDGGEVVQLKSGSLHRVNAPVTPDGSCAECAYTESRLAIQFHATDTEGNEYDVTEHEDLIWASEDETIASIDQSGVITGHQPGHTRITATFRDSTFSDDVVVVDNSIDHFEIRQRLDDTSTTPVVISGEKREFFAVKVMQDGSEIRVLNQDLIWSTDSTDISVNTIGIVTGEATGSGNVIVEYDSTYTNTNISASTAVQVIDTAAYTCPTPYLETENYIFTCPGTQSEYASSDGLLDSTGNKAAPVEYAAATKNNLAAFAASYCEAGYDIATIEQFDELFDTYSIPLNDALFYHHFGWPVHGRYQVNGAVLMLTTEYYDLGEGYSGVVVAGNSIPMLVSCVQAK